MPTVRRRVLYETPTRGWKRSQRSDLLLASCSCRGKRVKMLFVTQCVISEWMTDEKPSTHTFTSATGLKVFSPAVGAGGRALIWSGNIRASQQRESLSALPPAT